MSNAEHAIENAVYAMQDGKTMAEWTETDPNLERIKAAPNEVWDMASWVLWNWCGYCDKRGDAE